MMDRHMVFRGMHELKNSLSVPRPQALSLKNEIGKKACHNSFNQEEWLGFIEKIAHDHPKLYEESRDDFFNLLSTSWTFIYEGRLSFKAMLSTFCNAFPVYEHVILLDAYDALLHNGMGKVSADFYYLLEAMADYQDIEGVKYFKDIADIGEFWGALEELALDAPVADIAWILENRLDVPSEEIREELMLHMEKVYAKEKIEILLLNGTLNEFFKFAEGYDMFLEHLPRLIQRDSHPEDQLKKDFGLCVTTKVQME